MHYVLNFSRSMQLEFAKTNVKVQVVMPGPVRSEFFGEQKPPFPDQLFMSAETLVDSALSALDQGELVCFPTLHDEAAWAAFVRADHPHLQHIAGILRRRGFPGGR
jgi:uncharacterized protein